ncbi:hypothetical protein V2J09_022491 [Rumex salicifolius]
MEQFCQMGEVLGSLKAQMVLRDDNQINPRQCMLLFDLYDHAFNTIAEEIKQHLRLEEKATKWKPLEQPLRNLVRVFKEGDSYIKSCSETKKSWWVRAICLHNSRESLEYHIHNLMLYFPMAIEAIETAGEISGLDVEEMNMKRMMLYNKYHMTWNDPKMFEWKYGKNYLVDDEIVRREQNALMEDKWVLAETIRRKKNDDPSSLTRYEHHLGDLLIKSLNEPGSVHPSSIFTAAKDYQVKRRRDKGGQYKEIQWLGEGFVLRRFFTDDQSLNSEIREVLSLSHPNVVRYLCGFHDQEKKEYLLVMEKMAKDLNTYVKEQCGPKRRVPLPLPVAVDIILQVAKGMEYLHSHKIYHGNLNPSNVLIKARSSSEGYVHAKITGFDLKSIGSGRRASSSHSQDEALAYIWSAPEVLNEQEKQEHGDKFKDTTKADVYSFAMLSFQVLTGKIPFEDSHLKGEKMSRNIRAGERPLFPFALPKDLATLIKKCWQADPTQRPSFSSLCRILRYITRVMVMVPQFAHPLVSMPQVDICDIEAHFLKTFPHQEDTAPVTQIPFQLFSYRLVEMDKLGGTDKNLGFEPAIERTFVRDADESNTIADKPLFESPDTRSTRSDGDDRRDSSLNKFSTTTDDSVLASSTERSFGSGTQETVITSSIARSIFLTESDCDQQVQEQRSLCPEVHKNKPPRLRKTTSNLEPLSTRDMSLLGSEKKEFTLKKCSSFRVSKDQGISKLTTRLSLQKTSGNAAKVIEQGRSRVPANVSTSYHKPAKHTTDWGSYIKGLFDHASRNSQRALGSLKSKLKYM